MGKTDTRMSRGLAAAMLAAIIAMAWHADGAQPVTPLPKGVRAEWDLARALRQATPTRERICINGLWRWQPADAQATRVPTGEWGHFKVPGCWPGITNYMQKDCQRVYSHPAWRGRKLGEVRAAWYQREITIPPGWAGRRIALRAAYVNSLAVVYLDGTKAGEIPFPAGEVELTGVCRPGRKYVLSVLVVALPLRGVMLSYNDSNSARRVKGSVARRGLCGDVWLVAEPRGARLGKVTVGTSVRKGEITVGANVRNLPRGGRCTLRVRIADGRQTVKEFTGQPFGAEDLKNGRITLTQKWLPPKLWDVDTPANQYDLTASLQDAGGRALDTALPVRFGFRELWIDGRDFYLNHARLFLCAVPLDNAQVGAAWASYEGARESLLRLKSWGVNFVYTHNYGCEPGTHLSFAEILRAADDVGMLVALSQPHFGQYKWDSPDADRTNGYARHAAFYAGVAGNHPSVVMYSTSHNATGYAEDMNPDLIDGLRDPPRSEWSQRNANRARRAEAIVRRLDPWRIVYHHSSGNLGSMHTINFYPNWVPIQEMSDWFEHWATKGVKPLMLCEYGAPFTWDWSMYRGWYKGRRSFGSGNVPWDFCLAEWNAQFLGDRAYKISDEEKTNLRWEARQFAAGKVWHRWDYPHQLGSRDFDERYPILAAYLKDNWRAFRIHGVSVISPWEHGVYWKPRPGLRRNQRVELKTDWADLQRPGLSPDYLEDRYERMDLAYERTDWVPTLAAKTLLRHNAPVLVCLAGEAGRFTSKTHNYRPGETVHKQLIIVNNSRRAIGPPQRRGDGPHPSPPEMYSWTFRPREVPVTTGPETWDGRPAHASHPPQADLARDGAPSVQGRDGPATHGQDARATTEAPPIHVPKNGSPAKEKVRLHTGAGGGGSFRVAPGQKHAIPINIPLPADLPPGEYEIAASADTGGGHRQIDTLAIHVLAPDKKRKLTGKTALFDPPGQTTKLLAALGVRADKVGPGADLAGYDVLIIGKAALTVDGPAPDLSRVPQGLRVLVFEQTPEVLEKRLGFRVATYGLRNVFARVPDHPALAGLDDRHLRDWRGEATLVPPRLRYEHSARYNGVPAVRWCGLEVPRLWRCGNRGSVASALIEKPPIGDFLPIVDGGFSLQYSPLLEYRQGRGLVLFCQLDVTARTASDPAAERLATNLLRYVHDPSGRKPAPTRQPFYVGEPAGRRHLALAGITATPYTGQSLTANDVLILGPGADKDPSLASPGLGRWFLGGGHVLALGFDAAHAPAFLPKGLQTRRAEHIASWFPPPALNTPFAGVAPADVHNRAPRTLPLLTDGHGDNGRADVLGNGVLARAKHANVVFCQLVPWHFATKSADARNLRKTFRRTSFLLSRILANLGVRGQCPLLQRFATPAKAAPAKSILPNGDFRTVAAGDGRGQGPRPRPGLRPGPRPGQKMPDGWQFTSADKAATCTLAPPPPGVPGRSLRLAQGPSGKGTVMLARHDVAVQKGQWYLISLRARSEGFGAGSGAGGSGAGATLALQDTTKWRALLDYQRFTPSEKWHEFTFRAGAKATATSNTRFQIWHDHAGVLYLADLRLVPCPPPTEGRWSHGLYLDQPQPWDDPYRFFRW